MPISDPCTAVWLFLEIKQSCFIFTLQEMDREFRGRDNRETCALTFSASCQHQEKRNLHPKCQGQCVYRAVGKELEGHQEFSTDCRSKQDILDTLTILDALNLFEPAPESCGRESEPPEWKRMVQQRDQTQEQQGPGFTLCIRETQGKALMCKSELTVKTEPSPHCPSAFLYHLTAFTGLVPANLTLH